MYVCIYILCDCSLEGVALSLYFQTNLVMLGNIRSKFNQVIISPPFYSLTVCLTTANKKFRRILPLN